MKKLHIIGLGGGGCNALEHIYNKGVMADYTGITHPARESWEEKGITYIHYVPKDLAKKTDLAYN